MRDSDSVCFRYSGVTRMAGLYTDFTVKLFLAAIAITGTTLLSAGKVNARPYIYMDSYSHGNTHQKCIAQAKTVLQQNGFGNFDEDQYLEDRVSEITGYHNEESLTVEIECDQKLGTTSLAVSGLDGDFTYKMYGILFNASW